jgi:HK97 family phage major capsid protein
MPDRVEQALAAHDRELAALEQLNEQIQAAPSYGAAAGLIVEFESQRARVRAAAGDVERQKALGDARLAIPPYRDETDDEPKGAHMSRNWAVPRGGKHDTTYRPDRREFSYIRDLLATALPGQYDPNEVFRASERLRANQDEAADFLGAQYRDVTTGDPGAGSFIPPVYLGAEWIEAAVGGRPFADACAPYPYSEQGKRIDFPRVQIAPEVEVQAAEADPVNEVDFDGETYSVNKVTIAGQNDLSIQALDWSLPGLDTVILRELIKDYNRKLDVQLIYGPGSGGKHRGIKTVVASDGGNAISFSSGGADDLLAKVYEAQSDISTLAPGFMANGVVLHPRRAAWMGSHRDQNSNLLQQGQLPMAAGTQDDAQANGVAGLTVVIDPNIATNQGSGTNEDDVFVLDFAECLLAESPLRTRVLQEVLSGTLQVRIQAFGYSAFAGGRRPKVLARISGAGLATPTFPSS